jgi:excisionase family DNA binding protein
MRNEKCSKIQATGTANSSLRLALRPVEAAEALGICERKLWEITADRTSGIPHVRFGRAVLYPVAELERWLEGLAAAGKQV